MRQDGATALLLASHFGHLEVVRRLLRADADVDQARTSDGVTPLAPPAARGPRGGVGRIKE